jgi:hypothetical protein
MNSDDVVLLSYDEAVALLPDGDTIHTFLNPAGMLVGADWDREQVLDLLRTTDRREVTGPEAQSFGHGLAAWDPRGHVVFIETGKGGAS